ncbi:TasA family protein [Rossellomorea sp. FS2]
MGIKQKLGLGAASAVLGLSLIGGGTYAYFSDTAEATGTFAAGTLDLNVDPTTLVKVENLKPGDWVRKDFKLVNNGSLDIGSIDMITEYTVIDAKNNNGGEDFGDHIQVDFFYNNSGHEEVFHDTTLSELKATDPKVIMNKYLKAAHKGGSFKSKNESSFTVQFSFKENDKDQNKFQGDKLELKWSFIGKQTAGERKQ